MGIFDLFKFFKKPSPTFEEINPLERERLDNIQKGKNLLYNDAFAKAEAAIRIAYPQNERQTWTYLTTNEYRALDRDTMHKVATKGVYDAISSLKIDARVDIDVAAPHISITIYF